MFRRLCRTTELKLGHKINKEIFKKKEKRSSASDSFICEAEQRRRLSQALSFSRQPPHQPRDARMIP